MKIVTVANYILLICLFAGIASGVVIEYQYGDWENYEDIEVGDISQTAPTGGNRTILHYAGNGNPETATFEIDTSTATDQDRREVCSRTSSSDPWVFDSWDEEDAGLEETDTEWTCRNESGEFDDNGYIGEFTPSSEVFNDIWIKCKVGDDDGYSDGEEEEVTFASELTTFKVGVQMDPGAEKFPEDDPLSTKVIDLFTGSELADLSCTAQTSLTQTGTVTTNGSDLDAELTWTVYVESESTAPTGIRGTIKYTPDITATGSWGIDAMWTGMWPQIGGLGSFLSNLTGAYNPYAGAVAECVVDVVGTNTNYKYSLLAKTVIENVADEQVQEEDTGDDLSFFTSDNITGLSIGGTEIESNLTSPDTEGAAVFDSLVQSHDDSIAHEAYARITVAEDALVTFGSTKPVYELESP